MKKLEFKKDGTYLDDKRLDFITHLSILADVEDDVHSSHLLVTGVESDKKGNPILEDGENKEYKINERVIVQGLDNIQDNRFYEGGF